MVEQNKTVCFAKIRKPLRHDISPFEDWRNFDNLQTFRKFLE